MMLQNLDLYILFSLIDFGSHGVKRLLKPRNANAVNTTIVIIVCYKNLHRILRLVHLALNREPLVHSNLTLRTEFNIGISIIDHALKNMMITRALALN